jgi:RecB family endonuclease NucS
MNILEEGGHLRLTAGGSHIPLDRFQGAYQLLSDSDERKGRIGLELPVEDSTAHPLEEPEDAIEQQEEEEERNHLSLERDLEEQLVRNLDQVEPELRLFDEDGKVGRQLRSDTGIIDVLAVAKTGDLVVIELKAGRAPDRALAQLLDYMEWVENRLASGREVRGILLAAQFDGRLERAARRVPSVRLLRYRIRFEIEPV